MTLILIRYGELALKSQRVRRRFEDQLIDGIAKQFERFGMDWLIEQEQGRFFLHTPDEETDRAIFVLQHVPGISSVSPVKDFEITDGLGTIGKMAAEFSRLYLASGMSFGVRARRAGSHPFTSQEAAAFAGEKILEAIPGLKVNLTQPDVTIGLEIRGRKGFLFTESFKGTGGLPPGSQGKVMLLLSGPNSMTAGYLMMKRGCTLLPVHFTGGDEKVEKETLDAFERLEHLDAGMAPMSLEAEMNEETILELMEKNKALAVVSGARFENLDASFRAGREPVFYPLVGLGDKEIAAHRAKAEELYEQLCGGKE